ncbi:MAG TPA: cupin domain-containing protein [Tepidiformaceae bacterium]
MVKVTRPDERDPGTTQTPGMRREAAISGQLSGSEGLWMGIGMNAAGAVSGVHHHGESESGIYVLKGRIRFRWGDNLEHVIDTEPGDFVFVPPFEVHMEENLDPDNPAEFVLARNTMEGIVVNVPYPRSRTGG